MGHRIAYVSSDRGVRVFGSAGSSVHVRSMAHALASHGNEVDIFTTRRGRGEDDGSLSVTEIKPGKVAQLLEDEPGPGREIARAIAASEMTRRLSRAHREAPFDLVYERLSLWGTAGLEVALKHGLPFFLEVNSPLVDEACRHRGLTLEPAARAIERTLLTQATRVFVVSEPLVDHVVAHGAKPERVVVTPNGVDESLFGPVERRTDVTTPLTIAFVGSLKPWHGVPVLLEAFRRLLTTVEARLIIVGDGPLRDEVNRARAELGDSIVIKGAVAHEEVPGILATADVAVAPYPESDVYFSPLKVVEAMAAGAAVVASRSGDIPRLIVDGESGLLVTPGDPEALKDALLRLATDRRLAGELGMYARATVLARHTWRAVSGRVLDELRTVEEASP